MAKYRWQIERWLWPHHELISKWRQQKNTMYSYNNNNNINNNKGATVHWMEATLSFWVLEWLHSIRKRVFHCCCSISRINIMYNKSTLTNLSITVSWGVFYFLSRLRWDQIIFTLPLKDLPLHSSFLLLGCFVLEGWKQRLLTYLSLWSNSWSSGCFSSEETWISICESACGVASAVMSSLGADREMGGWTLLLWLAHPSLDGSSTCAIELVSLKESVPALTRWNNLWPVGKEKKGLTFWLEGWGRGKK